MKELTKQQLLTLQQALGYAVMYAKTESETAEFSMMKLDIDGALIRNAEIEKLLTDFEKKDCPFKYCDSNPPCKDKCRYS